MKQYKCMVILSGLPLIVHCLVECIFSVSSLKWLNFSAFTKLGKHMSRLLVVFHPDSVEATVHIMNEFIGSMSLGQPKKWGKALRIVTARARHDRTCINKHKLASLKIRGMKHLQMLSFIQWMEIFFFAFFISESCSVVYLAVRGRFTGVVPSNPCHQHVLSDIHMEPIEPKFFEWRFADLRWTVDFHM